MRILHKSLRTAALVMSACAGSGTAQVSDPATDPANPQATAAPVAPGYQFVQAPALTSPRINTQQDTAGDGAGMPQGHTMPGAPPGHTMPGMPHGGHTMPRMPPGSHDMPDMPQGNRGTMPDAQAPPHAGGRDQPAPKDPAATQYTCAMHPEIRRDKPGRCPKCGMKLVPVDSGKDGGQP